MLNVNTIKNGLVIDHIGAGSGWKIYQWLGLDKAPFTSCLIQNVPSEKSEKKDIIKIDNIINIDYSVLGFIDPNICVNVIENEKIVRKITMELPGRVKGVFNCKNPRCITQTEQYANPAFILVNRQKGLYKCEYCDTLYVAGSNSTNN